MLIKKKASRALVSHPKGTSGLGVVRDGEGALGLSNRVELLLRQRRVKVLLQPMM